LAIYYLETTALVKLYLRETGTDRLLSLADRSAENLLAILALAPVELRSAVRRRERTGEFPSHVAARLLDEFQRHVEGRFVIQMVTAFVFDIASALVDRYGLRAYDAVQLAGYLAFRGSTGPEVPILVCSDRELLKAAEQEGIPALDPSAA